MRAGLYRHRITIEQITRLEDMGGGYTDKWTTFATRWAEILAKSGRERYWAMQTEAVYTHVVRMRYLAGVTNAMRVAFGDHIYNIRAALDPDGTRRELHLLCEEEGAASDNVS